MSQRALTCFVIFLLLMDSLRSLLPLPTPPEDYFLENQEAEENEVFSFEEGELILLEEILLKDLVTSKFEFLLPHYPSVIKAAQDFNVPVRLLPNTNSEILAHVGDQAGTDILCQIRGDTVEGFYGTSNIWALTEFIGWRGYVPNSFVLAPQEVFVTSDCLEGIKEQLELAELAMQKPYKSSSPPYSTVVKTAQNVSSVTLHLVPNINSPILSTVNDQTNIDILCQIKGTSINDRYSAETWDLVRFTGGQGYVANSLIEAPQGEFVTSDCLEG